MLNDLTLLNYSSSRMPEPSASNFRNELLKTINGTYPIVSVTQKPIEFGLNICVGDIGQSYYNIYKQMQIGLQEVKTRYVAIIEDDTLYTMEHFSCRPSSDEVVSFNKHFWFLDTREFWTKGHIGSFGLIAPTDYLRNSMNQRMKRYPIEPMPREYHKYQWMEPGFEDRLGLPVLKTEQFSTKIPLITFCYYGATNGKPKRRMGTSSAVTDLEFWGNAAELRNRLST